MSTARPPGVANVLLVQPLVPEDVVTPEARDANVDAMIAQALKAVEAHCADAAAMGRTGPVDLIAFPELATVSYNEAAFSQVETLGEDIDVTPGADALESASRSTRQFAALATTAKAAVCFGVPRRDTDGNFWISQVVVGPSATDAAAAVVVGHFDKMHMINSEGYVEGRFFGPKRGPKQGERPAPRALVLSLRDDTVRVAPIICYDFRFPELSRLVAVEYGAHAILHCSAFPSDDELAPTRAAFSLTRAVENQCYFLGLNRAGDRFGDTLVVPANAGGMDAIEHLPSGPIAATRVVAVDTAVIKQDREMRHFWQDRLPSYANVSVATPAVAMV